MNQLPKKRLCLALLCLMVRASAAAESEGISVMGSGEATAKPNSVEIRVRVSGSGELASDALVKYLDHRRRTLAAIEQLKLKELKTESHGISVAYSEAQTDPDVPGAPSMARPSLQFSSVVRLAVGAIREQP